MKITAFRDVVDHSKLPSPCVRFNSEVVFQLKRDSAGDVMDTTHAPPVEFWRLPVVLQATGLSKSDIYRRIAEGRFPKARKYEGTSKSFWVSVEVMRWQRDQLGDDFEALL